MTKLIHLSIYSEGELFAEEFLYPADVRAVTNYYERRGFEVRTND